MKRILAVWIMILFIATIFTACSFSVKEEEAPSTEFKMLGDIIHAKNVEEQQSSYTEQYYVYVYKQDETYYRAIAVLSKDAFAKLSNLDIFSDDYDAKLTEAISPLVIDHIENLTQLIPAQSQLDQWVGKSGKDLFDAGWENAGWNLDEMVFWMDYGNFQYDVVMTGDVKNSDEFSEEDMNALVVKSVKFNGQLGNATDIGE